MSELVAAHLSVESWFLEDQWNEYFEECQKVLGLQLTHFDSKDPVRRKVGSLTDLGAFACAFGNREDSRWLFGRFGSSGVEFTVKHFKQIGHFENSFKW